jgi:imidazoleglycerol-phosphate dehydratase
VAAARAEGAKVNARAELAGEGAANVSTGLTVLDFLLGELARTARLSLSLEVAPGAVDVEVTGAGRGLGEALGRLLNAPGASGRGWAWLPADEALAGAVIEVSERPLVASNVDFSGQRVGGLGGDVVSAFLSELAEGAGLNIHIRVLEGKDPQNAQRAIFKALGAAIGQACRTPEGGNA